MAQRPWIVPIPGTTNTNHLIENMGASNVKISPSDLITLDQALAKLQVYGGRMNAEQMLQIGYDR